MANEGNLTPIKKGQVLNPNGRPVGSKNIKTLIKEVWDSEVTDAKGNKVTEGLLVVKSIVKKANEGDVAAFKALSERLEGMPKQEVEMNTNVTMMPKIVKDGKEVEFDIGSSIIEEIESEDEPRATETA